MYLLLNLINLIVFSIISYITLSTKKKFQLYTIGIFVLAIVVNIAFSYVNIKIPITGLIYNISNSISLILFILLLIPILNNKLEGLFAILPFFIDLITKVLMSLLFNISFIELNDGNYHYFSSYLILFQFFLYSIIFILYYYFKYKISIIEYKINMYILILLIIIELIGFFIINYFLVSFVFRNNNNYYIVVIFNIFLLILFILTIIFSYILKNHIQKKYEQLNQANEELLLNEFNSVYISSQEELFKLKHDISNIISSINDSEVKEELSNKINTIPKFYYTRNKLINAILTNKINYAKNNGINVDILINIENDLSISKTDIISLLCNLLDNSIEANQNEINKWIKLQIAEENGHLTILIQNPIPKNKIIKDNPNYHGFGKKIITSIVKKYHGYYQIDNINNIYQVFIKI
ncbi:MAG: GHKL domain-containing protein [Anaeroplasmataceae bacterium]